MAELNPVVVNPKGVTYYEGRSTVSGQFFYEPHVTLTAPGNQNDFSTYPSDTFKSVSDGRLFLIIKAQSGFSGTLIVYQPYRSVSGPNSPPNYPVIRNVGKVPPQVSGTGHQRNFRQIILNMTAGSCFILSRFNPQWAVQGVHTLHYFVSSDMNISRFLCYLPKAD